MAKIIKSTMIILVVILTFFGISLNQYTYAHSPDQDRADEYSLKAALIYYFIQFTSWPEEIESPCMIIGVYKDNPYGQAIDNVMEKAGEHKRRYRVFTISNDYDIKDCDVLIITRDRKDDWERILAHLEKRSILTITESKGMADKGAMINFLQRDSGSSRIGFEVNQTAAMANGIVFSSRMLSLAKRVIQ